MSNCGRERGGRGEKQCEVERGGDKRQRGERREDGWAGKVRMRKDWCKRERDLRKGEERKGKRGMREKNKDELEQI